MSMDLLRNRKVLLATIGILVLGGGAWGVVALSRDKKPAVPKEFTVDALEVNSHDPGKVFEQIHQAMSRTDLTEEQKRAIRENAHRVVEVRMEQQMDVYFTAKTDAARQAVLDQHIDQMLPLMKQMEQRRAQWQRERAAGTGAQRPPGGSGPQPQPGASGAVAGRPGGPAGAPGGPAAGPAGGPGGWRGRDHSGPPTRQERKTHTEARDPDRSARRMAYFTALRERAQQRGIQMPGFMGRGGPGGPH